MNITIPPNEEDEDAYDLDQITQGPVARFSQFTKLRSLEANAYILLKRPTGTFFGEDTGVKHEGYIYGQHRIRTFLRDLPENLESLTIRNCTVGAFEFLVEIAIHGIMPSKLKVVDLIALYCQDPYDPRNVFAARVDWDNLIQSARDRGIQASWTDEERIEDEHFVDPLRNRLFANPFPSA